MYGSQGSEYQGVSSAIIERPWVSVLCDFTSQIQQLVYGAWTLSFAVLTSMSRLDGLKTTLEQFNSISLDPIVPMLLKMDATIFIDVSEKRAYLETSSRHMYQLGARPMENLSLHVYFDGCHYNMKLDVDAKDSTGSFISFSLVPADSSHPPSSTDVVFVDDRPSSMTLKAVDQGTFATLSDDLADAVIHSMWSWSVTGMKMCTHHVDSGVDQLFIRTHATLRKDPNNVWTTLVKAGASLLRVSDETTD
jgi:hypothetical protein